MLSKNQYALFLWLSLSGSVTASTHIQHCTLNADYIYTVSNEQLNIKALSNTLSFNSNGTLNYNARLPSQLVDKDETEETKQIVGRLITSNLQRLEYQFENKVLSRIVNEIENRDIDNINADAVNMLVDESKKEFTLSFAQNNGTLHYHRQIQLSLSQQLLNRFQQDLTTMLSSDSEDKEEWEVESNANLYAAKALRKMDRLEQYMDNISENICKEVQKLHDKEKRLKKLLPSYTLTLAKVENIVL